MYKDPIQWAKIRKRYFIDKVSQNQIIKETGFHWRTIKRILNNPLPVPYVRQAKKTSERALQIIIKNMIKTSANTIIECLPLLKKEDAPRKILKSLAIKLQDFGYDPESFRGYLKEDIIIQNWIFSIIQDDASSWNMNEWLKAMKVPYILIDRAQNSNLKDRKRALTLLLRIRGLSFRKIGKILRITPYAASRYWEKYEKNGVKSAFVYNKREKKCDDMNIREGFFKIFHSPPSQWGINRTTWKRDDLMRVLSENRIPIGKDVIKEILESEGHRWKTAKVILTSNDTKFKEKIQKIQSILSNLSQNDRFFSIDEYGPFAVKMKGGKRLVAPNEYPSVPEFQKSKGCLILTAALELSRNQVTHFYSKAKNTDEMIKLLDLLLYEYGKCESIYLSWDAASWHVSKKLYEYVRKLNSPEYREKNNLPYIGLAPLPASAQFLNVIESVFSGMAKAIIHNSNYQSVDECRKAIDRYFEERNSHFKRNPKRAGKKIWGDEIVVSKFNEGQNCKDPRWR